MDNNDLIFSTTELQPINDGAASIQNGFIEYISLRTSRARLKRSWDLVDGRIPEKTTMVRKHVLKSYVRPTPPEEGTGLVKRTSKMQRVEYDIGMSDEFLKEVAKADAKLRGRILDALGQISRKPDTPQGDTVKPLSGDLKGLWRFRLGDYRLVYRPDLSSRRVTLLAFAGRGSVYD